MKKIFLFLIVILFSCSIFADTVGSAKTVEPKPIYRGLSVSNATPSSFVVIDNELSVLYVNKDKLRFRTKKNKVLLDKGQHYNPKKTWVVSKGKYVYAFWWLKFVYESNDKVTKKKKFLYGKSLYVRASDDYGKTFSPKVRINAGNGVLPYLKIQADEAGHVTVVYSDERAPRYQVYTNSSLDGGKTWLKEDIRLDKVLGQEAKRVASYAGTPHLVHLNNKLIAIWQQFDDNKNNPITRIIARESIDYGLTWGQEEIISEYKGDVSSTLDVVEAKDEVYVFWLDRKKQGIILFSRRDGTSKWFSSKVVAPGTSTNFAISWLRGVADEDNLYITFTYEKNPLKDYVATIKYDRKKRRWYPEVHRLDRHHDDLKYKVKSINSDIAILPNKTILVVWEDYDSILPGIHMDMLDIKSQKWQNDKIRLTKPGGLDARTPKIYQGLGKIWIVFYYNIMIDGAPPVTALASLVYDIGGTQGSGIVVKSEKIKLPSVDASRKMIESKVKAIWEARLNNNKEREWPYYDPVFRNRFNKKKWLKSKSKLTYTSYNIDTIEVHGIYARVRGKVAYKLPKKIVQQNTILDPEDKEDQKVTADKINYSTFSMKFGWFSNDWYFVPELMFMNHIDD